MSETLAEKSENGIGANSSMAHLDPVEVEIIQLFVQFSRALGQPRSLAEIYGLLFISQHPVTMDKLIERLNLSKGSASQGLKYLHDLGAVRTVYMAGDRRTYYVAVAELRNLAANFLRKQLLPNFEGGEARLDNIAALAKTLSGEQRKYVNSRVMMLRSWGKNVRRVVPFVLKILGGGT